MLYRSIAFVLQLWICSSCFAQRDDFRSEVYGSGCGYAGTDPAPRVQVEELIQRNDTATIYTWLNSKETGLQAYGAEAVVRLKRKGMVISSTKLLKVEALLISKAQVQVCRGCIHMFMELREALKEFNDQQ